MILKFIKFNESNENKNYFYKIEQGSYLICDVGYCSKSDRTFDINFFDLVKNAKLQRLLFKFYAKKTEVLIDFLSSDNDEKSEHLMKNPKLRILIEDDDLFIDVLEIFDPTDIRVAVKKYNI